jgi:hypothetical protein
MIARVGRCILLVAAACGGNSPPPSPVSPAPPELQGGWVTVLRATAEQVTLMLGETGYGITTGSDAAHGAIEVHGDQIEFSHSSACPGIGIYRWSLNGDSLLFTSRSEPCGGRSEALDQQT